MKVLTLIPLLFMPFLSHARDNHGIEFTFGPGVTSSKYFLGFSTNLNYRYNDNLFGIEFLGHGTLGTGSENQSDNMQNLLVTYGKTYYHEWWHYNLMGGLGFQNTESNTMSNYSSCLFCNDNDGHNYVHNSGGYVAMVKGQLIAHFYNFGIGVESAALLGEAESFISLGLILNFNL